MIQIYDILSLIALVLYLPFIILKKGPRDRISYIRERLGISTYSQADIWIHAVSVGEVIAALPFLNSLSKELPNKKIVLSTTTYTGQGVAKEKFNSAQRIMYMPWDTSTCLRRAVNGLRPRVFITVETELWPVLFRMLKKHGSHILLVNGRISKESFKGYKKIKPVMKRVFSYIDHLSMQGQIDAERIISIGADKSKVSIMGNFKFDISAEKKPHPSWLNHIKGNILLAGSTHKGEEEEILKAYNELKQEFKTLKLILAPRHPERFSEVEEILKTDKTNYIRRTNIKIPVEEPLNNSEHIINADVILLDTIGELSTIYAASDIAFIGGSLIPHGGHNILEPAYWAKPIIFGPHMENFPFAADFLKEGAAIMVKHPSEITGVVRNLLKEPEKARYIGEKAHTIIENNRGAVHKAIQLIRSYIGDS
jgi:3-deoxy-D-manno-octulosonic-acid transferase